jgi:hypothetical protein
MRRLFIKTEYNESPYLMYYNIIDIRQMNNEDNVIIKHIRNTIDANDVNDNPNDYVKLNNVLKRDYINNGGSYGLFEDITKQYKKHILTRHYDTERTYYNHDAPEKYKYYKPDETDKYIGCTLTTCIRNAIIKTHNSEKSLYNFIIISRTHITKFIMNNWYNGDAYDIDSPSVMCNSILIKLTTDIFMMNRDTKLYKCNQQWTHDKLPNGDIYYQDNSNTEYMATEMDDCESDKLNILSLYSFLDKICDENIASVFTTHPLIMLVKLCEHIYNTHHMEMYIYYNGEGRSCNPALLGETSFRLVIQEFENKHNPTNDNITETRTQLSYVEVVNKCINSYNIGTFNVDQDCFIRHIELYKCNIYNMFIYFQMVSSIYDEPYTHRNIITYISSNEKSQHHSTLDMIQRQNNHIIPNDCFHEIRKFI